MLSARVERTIYWRVLIPLLLAVLTLVLVSIGGFQALSGARAYVGGESRWSKASNQALTHLRAHATGSTTANDCAIDDWLSIPLGDRIARQAMEQREPDLAAARAGFLQGGNSPGDVEAMIRLFRVLSGTPVLRDSIDAWRHGDELVDELRGIGQRICSESAGAGDTPTRAANLRTLDRFDADLLVAESRFSDSLGQASRHSEQLLTGAVLLLAVTLAGGSAWIVMHSLHAQELQRNALLEANARWELAAEAAGVGVFVWNPGDDEIELDRRARLLYGLDPDGSTRIARTAVAEQTHPEDRDLVAARRRSATAGEPLNSRYRIVDHQGAVRHIEAIGLVRNPGAPLEQRQMFGVIRDVTDEVQATSLQLERDAAERSAQARSQFLSRLSHELRTPLNAVLGLAQLMELDGSDPLSAQQRQRIELVLHSGWHLLRLVDDVLDITRIDAGTLSINAVATDPREVLRASLALVEPERASVGVSVVDGWPAAPAPVLADPQRLQQVFVNLLSNACKYNQRGGRLTLGHREAANEVELTFTDEGRGLSASEQAELFQPFKRLAGTAQVPGTGLGLVVVKLLAEQMGGRVEVDSVPGRGTSFALWLAKA
jgi:signal transduction histidine kinase